MGDWGVFGVAGCERSGHRREKKFFRGNQMQCSITVLKQTVAQDNTKQNLTKIKPTRVAEY